MKQLTVAKLIALLSNAVKTGEIAADKLVEMEGCDCCRKCCGLINEGDIVLLTADTVAHGCGFENPGTPR